MYTSTIGRTFLNAYNTKNDTNYSAESFFKEKFIPLFFDHQKYMMTAGNSPLENPKISWDDIIRGKKPYENEEKRAERIHKMYVKIQEEGPSDTIARGYPVADNTAGTSGQKSNINYGNSKDPIYLSWIGEGLAIGVSGGVSILFNHPQILLDIYEGWKHYRNYLKNTQKLKGNQINTWNGHWISHRYDSDYNPTDPLLGFNPLTFGNISDDVISMPTISWVKIILRISLCYPIDNLIGYIYNIGQTNTTIGFIPFKLSEIRSIKHFYEVVFGTDKISFKKYTQHIEELYGTAYGIRAICQNGSIGIRALEPKDLKNYLPTSKGAKKIVIKDESDRINFNLYKIWIMAMLNDDDLIKLSEKIVNLLTEYEKGAQKIRTNRQNDIKSLFSSTSSTHFLQNMNPIMRDVKTSDISFLTDLPTMICNLSKDKFSLFITLIKFQHTLFNKQNI